MPELPEVETSRRGIAPHLESKRLRQIVVRQSRLRWPVEVAQLATFEQQQLLKVARRSKYLRLQFATAELLLHLGMSGSLRILKQPHGPEKHDHFDLVFDGGTILRYNDPRRFGCLLINRQGLAHPLLSRLGPEPLEDSFSPDYFLTRLKARKTAVKVAIMDASLVVGVGNIYAQEALFRAGINPQRRACQISKKRVMDLHQAIIEVLNEAIEAGGSSLRDFTSSDGKPGYFQHAHQVYGRAGKPCVKCARPLKGIVLAGRTTTYCTGCQR